MLFTTNLEISNNKYCLVKNKVNLLPIITKYTKQNPKNIFSWKNLAASC
jgi:hypothetical protein